MHRRAATARVRRTRKLLQRRARRAPTHAAIVVAALFVSRFDSKRDTASRAQHNQAHSARSTSKNCLAAVADDGRRRSVAASLCAKAAAAVAAHARKGRALAARAPAVSAASASLRAACIEPAASIQRSSAPRARRTAHCHTRARPALNSGKIPRLESPSSNHNLRRLVKNRMRGKAKGNTEPIRSTYNPAAATLQALTAVTATAVVAGGSEQGIIS